jgi:hypothetical protein
MKKLSKNISKKLFKPKKLPGLATLEIPRNKKSQFPDVPISKEHFFYQSSVFNQRQLKAIFIEQSVNEILINGNFFIEWIR